MMKHPTEKTPLNRTVDTADSHDSASQRHQNLGLTLKQQLDQMEIMLDILQQEHRALNSNNIALFEDTLAKKKTQISALEKIQPQLEFITRSTNGSLSKQHMIQYIMDVSSGENQRKILAIWETLQSIIKQCDEQNKINNRILYASQLNVKQVLGILRGNSESPQTQVYGSSGKQLDASHGKSIAVA